MATVGAMATMEHEARQRLTKAIATLSKRHGVEFAPPAYERNPKMAAIRELEANATFLEALAGSSTVAKGGGPISGSGELSALEADAQAEGVTLAVESTASGIPAVVTTDHQNTGTGGSTKGNGQNPQPKKKS